MRSVAPPPTAQGNETTKGVQGAKRRRTVESTGAHELIGHQQRRVRRLAGEPQLKAAFHRVKASRVATGWPLGARQLATVNQLAIIRVRYSPT